MDIQLATFEELVQIRKYGCILSEDITKNKYYNPWIFSLEQNLELSNTFVTNPNSVLLIHKFWKNLLAPGTMLYHEHTLSVIMIGIDKLTSRSDYSPKYTSYLSYGILI